jgi:hypothetical protein
VTSTPWNIQGSSVFDAAGHFIGPVRTIGLNAEALRRINAHVALVEALQNLVMLTSGHISQAYIEQARAALKLAGINE